MPDSERDLREALLVEAPVADERPWAYPWWGMVLVSLFVAYHAAILIVHNLPRGGLTQDLHHAFDRKLQMRDYLRTVGAVQGWSMFAPNPHRQNMFMRVFVRDRGGEVWDMALDVYGRRSYPYLFYDRMGKINRRIIDEKNYRRYFAAWVCREWERSYEGTTRDGTVVPPADEVQFVRIWSRVPPPEAVVEAAHGNLGAMWFDPMKLPLRSAAEESVSCATTRQAQLPPYLRERYGLPPAAATHYRPIFMRTWKDKLESEAEAKRRVERKRSVDGGPSRVPEVR